MEAYSPGNSPRIEFLGTQSRFWSRKKKISSCIQVLHKTSHKAGEISHLSREGTAKKCTKRCAALEGSSELKFKGQYPRSEREIKFRRCLFAFYIKRNIGQYHVVVVRWRQRNACTNKYDARAKLLFGRLPPPPLPLFLFLPSPCRRVVGSFKPINLSTFFILCSCVKPSPSSLFKCFLLA